MKRRVVKRWVDNTGCLYLVQERRFFLFWRDMRLDSGSSAYFRELNNAVRFIEQHGKVMYNG